MILKFCLLPAACLSVFSAFNQASFLMHDQFKITQLTHDNSGHTIHNSQCFSQDDEWIVYDTRNDDGMIAGTGSISMVNIQTGELRELYHTEHQTPYGPGVGAATFSPTDNRVIF